jgi:hypothetical protein
MDLPENQTGAAMAVSGARGQAMPIGPNSQKGTAKSLRALSFEGFLSKPYGVLGVSGPCVTGFGC